MLDYIIDSVCLCAKMCNVNSGCYRNSETDHRGLPHKEEVEFQMYEYPSFIINFILEYVARTILYLIHTLLLYCIISTHPSLSYLCL